MLWEFWLESAGEALGFTTEQAGIFLSLLLTTIIAFVFILATKAKKVEVVLPAIMLFGTITFIFLGWFPTWTGSIIALVLAIILGGIVTGGMKN